MVTDSCSTSLHTAKKPTWPKQIKLPGEFKIIFKKKNYTNVATAIITQCISPNSKKYFEASSQVLYLRLKGTTFGSVHTLSLVQSHEA